MYFCVPLMNGLHSVVCVISLVKQKLAVAVHCYGFKDWNSVKEFLPGRVSDQCRDRLFSPLSPTFAIPMSCPFSVCVAAKNSVPFCDGRTNSDQKTTECFLFFCRYLNSLSPSLRLGDWAYEEDRILVRCVQQYGKGRQHEFCWVSYAHTKSNDHVLLLLVATPNFSDFDTVFTYLTCRHYFAQFG